MRTQLRNKVWELRCAHSPTREARLPFLSSRQGDRSEQAGAEPPADAGRVVLPLLAKLLAKCGVLHACTPNADSEPPGEPDGEHGPHPHRARVADTPSTDALGEPPAGAEVGEAEADEDEDGAEVGGVADDGVQPRGDEGVFREECEVEGEEGPEAAVTGEAEEGAGGDEDEAEEEGPGGADRGRAGGGRAEDGGEGGREGGAGEVLGEDEKDVGGGAEPYERLLDLLRMCACTKEGGGA